ncbi:hypothetical protein AVEN_206832-1, partial [Araneus ventricosus]
MIGCKHHLLRRIQKYEGQYGSYSIEIPVQNQPQDFVHCRSYVWNARLKFLRLGSISGAAPSAPSLVKTVPSGI